MRGRPPKPIDPGAPPAAARFGSKLRERRIERGVTQTVLGELAGFTAQHISGLERAKAHPTKSAARALDVALESNGALLALVDAVLRERVRANGERQAARLCGETVALGSAVHLNAGDDDVEPTTRLGLLEAGAATALGVPVLGEVPARASEVDPALPGHLMALLAVLGSYDDANGPHEVLSVARYQLGMIAEYRDAARGPLRVELMRVEARWAVHTAWLCEDAGDARGRNALLDQAVGLARESDYPDVLVWARARQAQWSAAPRAIRFAEAGLRTPRGTPQALVLCAARAAHAHARIGDSEAAERMIAEADTLAAQDGPPAPLSRNMQHASAHDVRCWQARCWAELDPAKAVALYDDILRDWPRGETRDGCLFRARLAMACAKAGELDRAKAEAVRALAVYKQTRSASAARELKQLGALLRAA